MLVEILFESALRMAVPLWLAGLAGYLSERSGVAQIGLEGLMLAGAFVAAATASLLATHLNLLATPAGLLLCLGVGACLGALFAWFTVSARAHPIIVGTAFNIAIPGGLAILSGTLFSTPSSTPSLALAQRIPTWAFIAFSIFLAIALHLIITRFRFGLRLRAAGEDEAVAASLGIDVVRTRYMALICCGALAALTGAYLSVSHGSQFSRGMTAGRGFIALAALILSGWRPLWLLLTGFVFGLVEAIQIQLQGFDMPWLPLQALQALPYVVTLIVLGVFWLKSRAPKALSVS